MQLEHRELPEVQHLTPVRRDDPRQRAIPLPTFFWLKDVSLERERKAEWFRFPVLLSGRMSLSLRTDARADLVLESEGREQLARTAADDPAREVRLARHLDPGVYYISVTTTGETQDSSYDMKATFKPDDREAGVLPVLVYLKHGRQLPASVHDPFDAGSILVIPGGYNLPPNMGDFMVDPGIIFGQLEGLFDMLKAQGQAGIHGGFLGGVAVWGAGYLAGKQVDDWWESRDKGPYDDEDDDGCPNFVEQVECGDNTSYDPESKECGIIGAPEGPIFYIGLGPLLMPTGPGNTLQPQHVDRMQQHLLDRMGALPGATVTTSQRLYRDISDRPVLDHICLERGAL
ncbi:MAG: hypothetical protein R6X33_16055 [Candidatus Brocadiia bacterium]